MGIYVLLLLAMTFLGRAQCQTCYSCNYFQASSSDPGLQTVLGVLSSRQTSYTQCSTFPYFSRNSVPTVNCTQYNMSAYGNPMGGMPFTGWACMKQSYTVTLKNYGSGSTVSVPAVVRGCAPVQSGNPYSWTNCYSASDTSNPYVRAVITGLYFPQQNVGPIAGNSGGYSGNSGQSSGSASGTVCICYGNYCNSTPRSVKSSISNLLTSLALTSVLLKFLRDCDSERLFEKSIL